jgi:hypothetical protein
MKGRIEIHRAFRHEGVYYTARNVDSLPESAHEYYQKGGYITIHPLDPHALDGTSFASPAAREEAIAGGLTPERFEGLEPSGEHGFTVADVRSLIGKEG